MQKLVLKNDSRLDTVEDMARENQGHITQIMKTGDRRASHRFVFLLAVFAWVPGVIEILLSIAKH